MRRRRRREPILKRMRICLERLGESRLHLPRPRRKMMKRQRRKRS
jgi:hypothetical protein